MSNKCPNCNKNSDLSKDNKFRPFCSEKCKLIDFGAWATEKFQIPGDNDLNMMKTYKSLIFFVLFALFPFLSYGEEFSISMKISNFRIKAWSKITLVYGYN